MDIGTWLRGLGLQQYEQAFRDNAIDAAILPELTVDDLKDLGVSLVGHRRRLLAAISALRSGVAPDSVAATPIVERRQLTVMFAHRGELQMIDIRPSAGFRRAEIAAAHPPIGFSSFSARRQRAVLGKRRRGLVKIALTTADRRMLFYRCGHLKPRLRTSNRREDKKAAGA